MAFKQGQKIVHRAQRAWGVGVVIETADDGRRLAVRFAGRDGITMVSGRDPALLAVPDDTPIDADAGGPLDALAAGTPGPASAWALRSRALRLDAMRRADGLGALLSSRVHVLPHQVGAAGRILADRLPRFVLADEVGLGKTVEACLIANHLIRTRRTERTLVVAPETLTVQWLETITGQPLLADNPSLARSIANRFAYLDPLNHLQVTLLERYRTGDTDPLLQRAIHLTINGLATGLRNSG